MSEDLATVAFEQERRPGVVELRPGEVDQIPIVSTETLHIQRPFEPDEVRRPAKLAIIEMGNKEPKQLTVWGSATKAGNFDPEKGIILAPFGEDFSEAIKNNHYTVLAIGTADDPMRKAQIGRNDLSVRVFGKMGDSEPAQLEASVSGDGQLLLLNKGVRSSVHIIRCGVPDGRASGSGEAAINEMERLEVAEEAGEVAVENNVEAPVITQQTANDAVWGEATHYPGQRTPEQSVPGKEPHTDQDAAATYLQDMTTAVNEITPESADYVKIPLPAPEPVQASEKAADQPGPPMEELEKFTAKDSVFDELHSNWGLPEDIPIDQIDEKLRNSLDALEGIHGFFGQNGRVEYALEDLRIRLYNTMDSGMAHFDQQYLGEVLGACQQLKFAAEGLMERSNQDLLLPRTDMRGFDEPLAELKRLMYTIENFQSYGGRLDQDAVQQAYGIIQKGDIGGINITAFAVQRRIDDMRTDLIGFAEASKDENKSAAEQFANERISELAADLKKEGADGDVERAVIAMERYLDDAITSATSDPLSGLTFPERVVRNGENDMAKREGGAKKGQTDRPRRVAAEYAVDMLRGEFGPSKDDIVLTRDGKSVDFGQKRAAALMTLYGKNWLQVARAAGFKISNR